MDHDVHQDLHDGHEVLHDDHEVHHDGLQAHRDLQIRGLHAFLHVVHVRVHDRVFLLIRICHDVLQGIPREVLQMMVRPSR